VHISQRTKCYVDYYDTMGKPFLGFDVSPI
jgi:hypothetical protein